MVIEGIEAIRPELPELLEPGIEGSQLAGFQSIEPFLPFSTHADQAGLAQLSQVLGRPRLAKARGLHQIAGRPFPATQEFQQAAAVRFGYGFERARGRNIPTRLYNCQGNLDRRHPLSQIRLTPPLLNRSPEDYNCPIATAMERISSTMPSQSPRLALDEAQEPARRVALGQRAFLLRGFAGERAPMLVAAIGAVAEAAPFRHMLTPGGWEMSVAMTNCGQAGWITDRSGYRYDQIDPASGQPWPAMPKAFAELASEAAEAAGFSDFRPDACLINRYAPGARLSLHQDRDERDYDHPIVSVSLGLPAIFLWGGTSRADKARRIPLGHGDVVVWGGPDRLRFHGVHALAEGEHPLTGACRFNLTLRRAL